MEDSYSVHTIQSVDYTQAKDPHIFADAWVVRYGAVCRKYAESLEQTNMSDGTFMSDDHMPVWVCLVFVSGPNAGCDRGKEAPLNAHSVQKPIKT